MQFGVLFLLFPLVVYAQFQSKRYTYLSSWQLHRELLDLELQYPTLVRLHTAQDRFGLPYVGTSDDCASFSNQGCPIYTLTVEDRSANRDEARQRLPEVILNGGVHGDERVGPTAVLATVKLLLQAADCVIRDCVPTGDLESVSKRDIQWLARLVTTRRIVVLPVTNFLGYDRNERFENDVDVNRDFPYDHVDSSSCMRTVAARTLNELFSRHMFQMGLVYHGGLELLGYEWGCFAHAGSPAPDDVSQASIAAAASAWGGSWSGVQLFPHGRIDEMVYTVRGGMEDWAYAGSWDRRRMRYCQTADGYDMRQAPHHDGSLRVFSMLVETSEEKAPVQLGSSSRLLDPTTVGHIPRNVRLALLAIDIVEPYVVLQRIQGVDMDYDLIPTQQRSGRGCQLTTRAVVPADVIEIEWTVGGGLQVDETGVYFGLWDDVPDLDCQLQPRSIAGLQEGSMISNRTGFARFSEQGETTFKGTIDLTWYPGEEIVILVSARMDQEWSRQPRNSSHNVPIQSHLANVRTNPGWYFETDTHIIEGRRDWFSFPITIQVQGERINGTRFPVEDFVNTPEPMNDTIVVVDDSDAATNEIEGENSNSTQDVTDNPATNAPVASEPNSPTEPISSESSFASILFNSYVFVLCLLS